MDEKIFEHVVIIGNGFDLNLGLPTSYNHFLESPSFNSLLEFENKLAAYLLRQKKLKNWIDIENELSTIVQKKPDVLTEANFEELTNALLTYFIMLNLDVEYNDSYALGMMAQLAGQRALIYNFNYTNTAYNLLNLFDKHSSMLYEHHFVHGSKSDRQIIFGVEDTAIVGENLFLKKGFPPHYSPPIRFVQNLINADKITIFGHSLGKTDHSYFQELFKRISSEDNSSGKTVTIYYYGRDSYRNLIQQLEIMSNKNLTALRTRNQFKMINTSNYGFANTA